MALHELDGKSIYEWMRWSARRQFGMLPVYIPKKPEEFDKKVMSKHPFIPMWIGTANIVKAKFNGTMDNISYLQYDINVN